LLSIVGGVLGFCFNCTTPLLEVFLKKADVSLVAKEALGFELFRMPETWMSIIGAFVGIGTGVFLYILYADRLGPTWAFLRKSFYVDDIYWNFIAKPLEALSKLIASVLEPKVFQGFISSITQTTQRAAHWLQQVQSGQIRSYVAWMVVGM